MKNNILLRTLVRLTKKYHIYDILYKNITKEQIIKCFNSYNESSNLTYAFKSILDDLIKVNDNILYLQHHYSFFKDFNNMLYAFLYQYLKEFLTINNIYDLFINNLKFNFFDQNINSFDDYIDFFKRNNFDIRNFIIYSFIFVRTAEGYKFWMNIHKKYVLYISNVLIK